MPLKIFNKIKDKNLYQLSICAIFKNEARYLREWIEFHRIVGVEHFYLYNNNSTDGYLTEIENYIKEGIVDLFQWEMHPGQGQAYMDCIQYQASTKWLAVIDIDEFLFPVERDDLLEVLEEYDEPDRAAVCVAWESLNSAGEKFYRNDYVINRFRYKIKKSFFPIKSVIRPERVLSTPNPHIFIPKAGFVNKDETGKIIQSVTLNCRCRSLKLCINHYALKSFEEWKIKQTRGRATVKAQRTQLFFDNLEKYPAQLDERILRFLPALKQRLPLKTVMTEESR